MLLKNKPEKIDKKKQKTVSFINISKLFSINFSWINYLLQDLQPRVKLHISLGK